MVDGGTNILLVEDNLSYSKLVEKILSESGSEAYIRECVDTISKGLEALENTDFDLVLLDLKLPDSEGLDTFKTLHDYCPDTPVIVLTATSDERKALEAVKSGAQDYLIKGEVDGRQLDRSIRYAVERQREMNKIKQVEYALSREKERLSVTLGSIGDGVITTDTQGRIETLNRVAEILSGWTQEEASGKNIEQVFLLVDEESGERKGNPVIRAINANGTVGLHKGTVLVTKGREEFRYVSASSSPIRDKNGIIIGVVLVFRDITQRKKMEEELLKAQKLESIGVLAGGIAHDFNNLLTAIMGNISLSKVSGFKDNNTQKRLLEAESACEKAKDLATQLLTFSKGGAPDSRETTSLEKVIRDTTNFTMSGSDLDFKFIVDRDIWPVEIDQGQMSQVISNLLINASQAMTNEGKITIKLENTYANNEKGVPLNGGKYVKTTVEDEGIGIPREYLSRIFDPYFTTKQHGSGLGLATSYSIIKSHGGYIAVDSELHMGTKFYIYIPANGRLNGGAAIHKENGIVWGSGRVLVMDDKHEVLEAACEMLSHIGYEVDYAKDGSEALKKYKSARQSGKPFDSVIMDLTIPGGMGGEEALQKLRVIDPDVKAIVSSGYASDPIMAKYKEYGFKAVLPKPYEVKKLSSVLSHVLQENN